MENLNAEQVKRGLEQFHRRILNTNLAEKVTEQEMVAVLDALALINSQEQRIKELSEKNEGLRLRNAENAVSAFRNAAVILDLQRRLKNITEENERLEKLLDDKCDRCIERERAYTVKQFAERLKAEMSFGRYIQADQIDQIAKEMLEGENEGQTKA